MAFRNENLYSMDYEDMGGFGSPTVEEIIAQIVAPVAQPVATQETPKATIIDNLTKQILAQGTTEQWTGEGKGSAEANAKDMAKILADTGITDINQFGEITKTTPAYSYETEQGTVDVPEQTITTYGNKETGQEVANTYSERQQGNAFGGTFEGSGNTGYRVDMSSGAPVFYTTEASSNDLFNILADNPILNTAATVAANYFGGPLGVAALNAVQGKDFEDVAKATALAYAGNQASQYLGSTPTAETVSNAELNSASDIASTMADEGLSIGQISQQLESVGYQPEAISSALEDAINIIATQPTPVEAVAEPVYEPIAQPVVPEITAPIETVQVTAPQIPVAPTISDVISSIVQTQVAPSMPEVVATAERPQQPEQPVIPVITPTVPELVVTEQRPVTEERPIAIEPPSSITEDTTPIPVITPSAPIDTTLPEKKYTTGEIVDMIRLGLMGAGLLAGANADTGPTQYDIVPVPADWKSPVYQKDLPTTAPTQLPPIDFGTRDLLKGTQWEKFLDPNYGQVPAPVQFNQPTGMGYDQLMSILGTSRDTLPSQALSINDVISGIQNQYGQTPTGSMGQKPA